MSYAKAPSDRGFCLCECSLRAVIPALSWVAISQQSFWVVICASYFSVNSKSYTDPEFQCWYE